MISSEILRRWAFPVLQGTTLKRQTWGDLVKLSYRPTNLTDSYWESVVLVHSTRGYKTLALVCCMRLWRVQVSSKTELSSQNLSQLVTKLAPHRCYGHPVFVYNTVKLYNIHEKHGLSPTMTIFCRVNTPRKKTLLFGTFALLLVIKIQFCEVKNEKTYFLFWAWNEKSCKWGFLPLINHFTHVAWQPSLSLSLDVSMQPVAPGSILWKQGDNRFTKEPPLLRIQAVLLMSLKAP